MSFLQKSVGIVQCLPNAHVARAVRYLSSTCPTRCSLSGRNGNWRSRQDSIGLWHRDSIRDFEFWYICMVGPEINKAMFGNLITKSRHAQNMSDCCPVCFWAFWLLFLFRSFRCGSAVIVSSCTLLSIIIVTLGFLMSSHAERPLETDAWARPN